jgi:site-specific recombinase XerD
MNEKYEMAADAVREFLEVNQYAYGTRSNHLRCYRLLGTHYAKNGGAYSRETAETWLQSISSKKCETEIKRFRRALEKFDAAYHNKEISKANSKSNMRQIYRCLEPWCNALLAEFVVEMKGSFGLDYTRAAKVSIARFLSEIANMGIDKPEDITHRIVVDYCRDEDGTKYVSKQAGSADRGHIRRFLQHLCANGMICESTFMALDQSVFPRLVFIDSLDAGNISDIIKAAKLSIMSAERYYEMALKLKPVFVELRYAATAQHTFHIAYKELYVFLEANSLGYSAEVALLWANIMSRYTVQWMAFRRAIMLFEQFKEDGWISPGKKYRYQPDRAKLLPSWCRTYYESYIRLKEKADLAESTLAMCRSSCIRFLEYLCSIGIDSWEHVSPEILKEFHRQDFHSTPESKNAYSIKIRQFLEYLGELGQVPPALFLAVPSESARRTRIVSTLTKTEIEGLYSYKDSADNDIELRDVAMILMGLRMGLRASDITELRYSDIAWEQKFISVQQKKTDSFLKLPMPTEVGNAIFRYITEARPESGSDFVFINHKAPYGKLSRSVCHAALLRALPDNMCGFHATRRTFASRMLVSRVEAGRIAETLGHLDNSNVMIYLSTDGERMRQCALSLDAIPVSGGALS